LGNTATATATFVATNSALSNQTPPRAAMPSMAGTGDWVSPSNPQLPASSGPDRTTSVSTHTAGNSTMQAASDRHRSTRRSDR
jgi:hypothetical protein